MYRKINVYVNGNYAYSTNRHKTLRSAVNDAKTRKGIEISSIPAFEHLTIKETDKVSAKYAD